MRDPSRLSDFIAASAYTDPVDIKKLKFIYSVIERYASLRGREFEKLHILEVACGTGGITLPLASLGCEVSAFDIDATAVESLRAQVSKRQIRNVTVTVDNGYTFDDGKAYDVVLASEVFEHVMEPSRLAENITRRMVEGSYLIMTTPNGYGPWEMKNRMDIRAHLRRWNTLRRLRGKTPYSKGAGGGHCQFYTKGRLLKLFSGLGLQCIDFANSDSVLTMVPQVRRSPRFGSLDARLADTLPYWLASGWYFVFEFRQSSRSTAV